MWRIFSLCLRFQHRLVKSGSVARLRAEGWIVELIDVNVIRAQIVQEMPSAPRIHPHWRRRLRRNIDFFPHALKRFAKLLLAVCVEPRGIKKVIPASYAFRASFTASSVLIRWIGSAPNPFLLTVIPVFPSVTLSISFLHILLTHIVHCKSVSLLLS